MVSNLVIMWAFAALFLFVLIAIAVRQQRRRRDLDSHARRVGSEGPKAPPFEPRF